MANSLAKVVVEFFANAQPVLTALKQTQDGAKETADKTKQAADRMNTAFTSMSSFAQGVAQSIQRIAVVGTGALVAFGGAGIKAAGDFESTSQSMKVLIGNTETANKLFGQLAKYANTTPFEFNDIAKGAQVLLGFGISSEKVYGNIQTLGDIAAATGADFSSLALVFGQVNATGKLMGQDSLQLINNKIPITSLLAKKLGVSVQEVRDQMEKGKISADLFNSALLDATKEGGFAFKGTETLAKSFNGRLSTMKDSITSVALSLVGVKVTAQGLEITAGGVFDRVSLAVQRFSTYVSENQEQITAISEAIAKFAIQAGTFLVTAVTKAVVVLKTVFNFLNENRVVVAAIIGAIVAFNVALLAMSVIIYGPVIGAVLAFVGPIVLVGAAIAALGYLIVTNWDRIKQKTVELGQSIIAFAQGFGQGITDKFNQAVASVNAFWASVVTAFTLGVQAVGTFFDELPNRILFNIGKMAGYIYLFATQDVPNAIEQIGVFFNELPGMLLRAGTNALVAFIGSMLSLRAQASEIASNTIQAVVSFFLGLPARVTGAIDQSKQSASSAWTSMGETLKNITRTFIDSIIAFFTGLPDRITASVNSAFDSVTKKIGAIGDSAKNIGSTIASGFKSVVPGFASGVTNFGGGLAMINERGPELVNLPKGTDVIPAQQTKEILSGGLNQGGATINVSVSAGLFTGSPAELRNVAELLSTELRRLQAASGGQIGLNSNF